jgi:hypothetical protein
MIFRTGLALSLLALLSACAAPVCPPTPPAEVVTKTRVVDTACDWVKPIYLDKTDVLSDETAKAILAHDKAGAKACNWKPLK